VIEQNIFFQNSFPLMIIKEMMIYRDPKYSFMWKSDRFIYKVFVKENIWTIGSQDWTLLY